MNTTNPKAAALTTLMANIRNAVRNRQTTTIGGGDFTYVELRAAAECIEEILAAPVAQPTAIDALRAAETALALACSYRDITRSKDGDRIQAALEGARHTLTAHDLGAPEDINAKFGREVILIMRDEPVWDSDTTQAIADTAANLGISLEGDQEGGE